MKRLSSLIRTAIASVAFAASLLSLSSCSEVATGALEVAAEELNDQCPIDYGDGLILTRVYVSDNYFTYCFVCDSDYVYGANTSEGKRSTINELRRLIITDSDVRSLAEMCVEAEKGIKYEYTDTYGNTGTIIISYGKIEQML